MSGSWVIGGESASEVRVLGSTIFLQYELCFVLTAKEQEINNTLMIFGKFFINE